MRVQILPAAPVCPLPGSVKVAQRSVKPFVLVRVQPWQPYQAVARVAQSSERGASNAGVEGGSPSMSTNLPGCIVSSRRPPSEGGGRRCNSCHPDHFSFGRQVDISWRHLSRKQDRHDAGVGALPTPSARPVAQKQSARLISGRPRSVTVPDDHHFNLNPQRK